LKVAVFVNTLGLGGTEKAACRWAMGLRERGHAVRIITLKDGPRRAELEEAGLPILVPEASARAVADALKAAVPDVIHAHAPGNPHEGDILGEALRLMPRIPVVQTNIFGRFRNPKEDAWTDFRLFISWTSCVQAARRAYRRLDEAFFRRASVAVYPLDPLDSPPAAEVQAFRERHGVEKDEVLFGRFSRPEPNKWTSLALDAFRVALRRHRGMKLLLREPPPAVAAALRESPDADRFLILPATADPAELRLNMAAVDAVLHTSSIGESFGYGIAEPMNLGKPVITHSVPWVDQAQIELVRHGECGFVASTPRAMGKCLERLAHSAELRSKLGAAAQAHIRTLADPGTSISRLEGALRATVEGKDSPFAAADLELARQAAAYLDAHEFGYSLAEQLALRPFYYRVRFHQFRESRRLKQLRPGRQHCSGGATRRPDG
jgi:glycosyltransferase involved in cell wall biosynthesis